MKIIEHQIPRGPNGEKDLNDWDRSGMWDEMMGKTEKSAKDSQEGPKCNGTKGPMAWIEEFTLTDSEVEAFEDPEWIYDNLIISGHILALAADPGAGKTTIATSICGDLVQSGYKVFYVLADIGQSDIKHYQRMKTQHGWTLAAPDIKAGHSMMSVVEKLEEMNQAGGDLSGIVCFFDTLKKMANVIQKDSSRKLMGLLRGLTAKGMTVVLLGHTNKYKDAEGEPIFEGTHDIKTDSDDLVYLIPMKQDDGSLLVSTKPSTKVRGHFEPITFKINKDRSVEQMEKHIDTAAEMQHKRMLEDDEDAIEIVREAIRDGKCKQQEIVAFGRERGVTERPMKRVLKEYSREPFKLWKRSRGFERNCWIHELQS